jgi:hypothetical protein
VKKLSLVCETMESGRYLPTFRRRSIPHPDTELIFSIPNRRSSETSENIYYNTFHHIPQDNILHTHFIENIKYITERLINGQMTDKLYVQQNETSNMAYLTEIISVARKEIES